MVWGSKFRHFCHFETEGRTGGVGGSREIFVRPDVGNISRQACHMAGEPEITEWPMRERFLGKLEMTGAG